MRRVRPGSARSLRQWAGRTGSFARRSSARSAGSWRAGSRRRMAQAWSGIPSSTARRSSRTVSRASAHSDGATTQAGSGPARTSRGARARTPRSVDEEGRADGGNARRPLARTGVVVLPIVGDECDDGPFPRDGREETLAQAAEVVEAVDEERLGRRRAGSGGGTLESGSRDPRSAFAGTRSRSSGSPPVRGGRARSGVAPDGGKELAEAGGAQARDSRRSFAVRRRSAAREDRSRSSPNAAPAGLSRSARRARSTSPSGGSGGRGSGTELRSRARSRNVTKRRLAIPPSASAARRLR